jgi:hypothetical protein
LLPIQLIILKNFRYILIAALVCLSAFFSVLWTSCKNKCGSTVCQNGGTCSSNACVCPVGYSGYSCQTGWDDVAIGTYHCYSHCKPAIVGAATWLSAVTKDATNGGYVVDISNFDNSNTSVSGNFDSLGNFRIYPASGSYGIDANGKFSNDSITMVYTSSSVSGSVYTCSMTMVKE